MQLQVINLKSKIANHLVLTLTRALQFYQLLRLGSVIGASILLAKSGLSLADIGVYEALL